MGLVSMMSLPREAGETNTRPTSVWPYFDKIQIWLRQPIDRATADMLRKMCGRGGIYVDPLLGARFDRAYRQRIELRQPSPAALQWVANRPDALINRLEIALDYIFKDINQKDEAFDFLHRRLVRRWHGKKQKIKLVRSGKERRKAELVDEDDIETGQTRYDAGRAPNKIVFYRNQYSRITGELHCLHLEWHANGKKAVQALGIKTGEDLLKFDHRAFWKRRLLLYRVEEDRLGRLVRNQHSGKRRRVSNSLDERMGHVLISSVGSVQELIDQYGPCGRISRALRVISNEGWLPRQ
jgi:hypothetical protein